LTYETMGDRRSETTISELQNLFDVGKDVVTYALLVSSGM